MDLIHKKKLGFKLKSNWQELDNKSIFFTYTKNIEKFKKFEILCIKKNCSHIICDNSFKKTITKNIKINYLFTKDLNKFAIKCTDIFFNNKTKIILVTGTNGKTSIAYGLYNTLNKLFIKTSYIGTLGFYANRKKIKKLSNTTPDLITLMNSIQESIKKYKCKYVILEASSIGFVEKRLGGIKADFGVLTNLTQDHIDYHGSILNYHKTKIKLLKNHLNKNSNLLIQDSINIKYHKELSKKFNIIDQNKYLKNNSIQLIKSKVVNTNLFINNFFIKKFNFPNNFVIKNLLSNYICLKAMNMKFNPKIVFNNTIIKGRHHIILDKVDKLVIVDFAHTPDGVNNLLLPYDDVNCNKIVIFGCGGDRDKNKRSKMSKLVNKLSDFQIITDDNPRNENPEDIRAELIKHCDNFYNIGDRLKAIKKGFFLLEKYKGILFIIGKGHEETQSYKNKIYKFSDIKESLKIAKSIN